MSKAFTAKTFAFLHQVNRDSRLKKIDTAVSLELSDHFNEEQDGRAWPGCKAIADAIGVSEHTVIRSVRRLAAEGHLRVIWGCQGRGHPNQYWIVLKPASMQVSEAGKPASATRLKPAPVVVKPAPVQENHLKNHTPPGAPAGAPRGEGERETRVRARPPLGGGERLDGAAPQVSEGSKEEPAAEGRKEEKIGPNLSRSRGRLKSEDSPLGGGFAELREVYDRGHLDDPEPDRLAYERAIARGASHDAIMAGARLTVDAADAPRFLKPLWKWLDLDGWRKPPARKASHGTRLSSPRRNGHKVDLTRVALKIGGYQEDADGNLFWPGEGAVQ